MDKEEVVSFLRGESSTQIEISLFVVDALPFVRNDFDYSTLTQGSLITVKVLFKCLVSRSDHLVEGKLNLAGQVVTSEIIKIIKVVNVVDNDLIVLKLLEVIGHFKVFDPLGVKAIHDNLRLTDLLPEIALLFEKNAHAICPGERIQVWQIFALERK